MTEDLESESEDDYLEEYACQKDENHLIDTRRAVVDKIGLFYPITYDVYNICRLTRDQNVSSFKVKMLKQICNHTPAEAEQLANLKEAVSTNTPNLAQQKLEVQLQSVIKNLETLATTQQTNAHNVAAYNMCTRCNFPNNTNNERHFTPGVGQGNPEFMTVEIKVSKTDPFRLGQTITVGASNSPLCPVLAMKKYLLVRKTTGGPLFVHVSG
jgi:hypothetical protein